MLRHLYAQGKVTITTCTFGSPLTSITDLDVKDLKTPALCVRCWRLADYVQLETLKKVAVSSLGQHLDAMAFLASSSYWDYGPQPTPKWLGYLLEGLREVCRDDTTKPIHTMFTTFLWVTRFELLTLPETLDSLKKSREVNRQLTDLLIFEELDDDNWSDWIDIPWGHENMPRENIARRNFIYFDRGGCCTYCERPVEEEDLLFYNPFPMSTWKHFDIGDLMWCKSCATGINEQCKWPWRWGKYRGYRRDEVKLEAWTWSDDE